MTTTVTKPQPSNIVLLRVQAATAEAQDPEQRVRRTWLIDHLLDLITTSPDQLVNKASELLSAVLVGKQRPLRATYAAVEKLVTLFDLELLWAPMTLPTALYETPKLLNLNLANLEKAFYNNRSESSCRIAVDYMIVAANMLINELHPLPTRSAKRLKTPQSTNAPAAALPLHIFLELELQITLPDADATPVHVTGRADWALSYRTRNEALDGTVFVAIEAKRRDQFGGAEVQLLTLLAMLRQLRIDAGKQDCLAQGCYTDGERYAFMCVDNDGRVARSNVYDIRGQEQRNVVFNYIVAVLESAVRTSPTMSPMMKESRGADEKEVGANPYESVYNVDEEFEILDEEHDSEGVLYEIADP